MTDGLSEAELDYIKKSLEPLYDSIIIDIKKPEQKEEKGPIWKKLDLDNASINMPLSLVFRRKDVWEEYYTPPSLNRTDSDKQTRVTWKILSDPVIPSSSK